MSCTESSKSLFNYIETIYKNLNSEEIFSRAKEYSWQTFFHHVVSVATASYRLGSTIKRYASSISKKSIESIEKDLGLRYEDLLFLTGIGHDYVKLHGIEEGTGEERVRNLIHKMVSELFILTSDTKEKLVSKVMALARAVEGKYTPELEEEYILYVAPVVRIIDELMGRRSIDEAIVYLQTSKEVGFLSENYGVKFGFVKTSLPSILHVKVSENIVEVLSRSGWIPLVVYADGLVLVGTETSKTVSMEEVAEVIKSEVLESLKPEESIKRIIERLKMLQLSKIYAKLVQTRATILLINEEKLKEKDREVIEAVYHDLIVKYLKGTPILNLNKEVRELKSKLGRGTLLDPRSLATGISKRGSTYFKEALATMTASKEDLIESIMSKNKEEKFLILSYMVVFPSKEESDVIDILREALNTVIPKGIGQERIDTELIRIVAMAEVYKHLNDEEAIRRLVEVAYEKVGGSEDIDYYVFKFIQTRLKSNIINTETLSSLDVLSEGLLKSRNYCRICGEKILRPSIRFIQYAQAIGKGGGASEIWLHDDPPLADLEKIATDKKISIRYICPLCYYEATQLKGRYSPPFFVAALHPVVAYDLWSYLKNRLTYLSNIYELLERRTSEVVRIYEKLLDKDMKVTPDILSEIAEREILNKGKVGEERAVVLFDSLGARAILPLGRDMSLKKKDVALTLALAPLVMSLSGGGQVGLASNLGEVYNLGSEMAPVVTPHPSNIVLSIVKDFENIRRLAGMMRRQMTLDEYAVYNRSYITLLEALYIYGLKIFCWYNRWRRKRGGKKRIEDYALSMHEYMSSIPYVSLALDAPPPESLDPREGDEPLPRYSLISLKSSEVESRMSQISKVLEGREHPSLNKLLYRYAVTLKELSKGLNIELSRYKVQRPLRKGIELLLQFSLYIGEADAKGIATDKYLELLAFSIGVDLEAKKKKVKDEKGQEREVSYRAIFFDIFDKLADLLIDVRKKLPPSRVRELVEVILDSAYEKYKYAKLQR